MYLALENRILQNTSLRRRRLRRGQNGAKADEAVKEEDTVTASTSEEIVDNAKDLESGDATAETTESDSPYKVVRPPPDKVSACSC